MAWTPPTPAQVDGYFDANNWGRWGHDDQLGTVNLITPAKQAAAEPWYARARRLPGPPHRAAAHRTYYVSYPFSASVRMPSSTGFGLVYHGYAVTHIDALCHVAFDKELYNGRPFKQSFSDTAALWCPIDPLFGGISTRGVLLDVAAGRNEGYVTVGNPVTPQDLDAAAARAGVRVEPGTWWWYAAVRILLSKRIRTGCHGCRRILAYTSPASPGSASMILPPLPGI